MKLSDAVLSGATVLGTQGPNGQLSPVFTTTGGRGMNDVLSAAQIGLIGRIPDGEEYRAFYWSNPWGATHGTPLCNWMRLCEAHKYRWADVINKLRGYGA